MSAAIRFRFIFLLLGSCCLLVGCKPAEQTKQNATAPDSPKPAANADPTWAEAVDAVRNGESVEIRLTRTEVSDEQLADLAGLAGLRRLNLPHSKITDDGLKLIAAAVPDLELLRLGSPRVTDAGMAYLPQLEKLRFLHLIDVPITDQGLKPLYEMTWLESFYLDGGEVSDRGLSDLLKKLPELHFHRDQHHLPDDPHKDGH